MHLSAAHDTSKIDLNMKRPAGFTLVETLIALAILGIFFAAITNILQVIFSNLGLSRVRATALAMAQAKIEIIRNLPYADVGTTGGLPQGSIAQTETVTINNTPFTVQTSIIYVDDPADGVIPADLISSDYKRARVSVSWSGAFPTTFPVTLVTNVVPRGLETTAGGGTLYLRVFDANGSPVANANIAIDNSLVNPAIHTTTLTDTGGSVMLPGAPACNTCYAITVTKSGYSTDKTYAASEVTNPIQPLLSVIEGELTQASFSIDLTGSVTIKSFGSRQLNYPPIANVQLALRGTKIIGYDSLDNPVYKYNYSTNTGGGILNVSNLELDSYILDFTNSNYSLTGSNPLIPFVITPGSNQTISFAAVPKTNYNLLLVVKNNLGDLQSSASARLANFSLGFDATSSTAATGAADFGQTFFNSLSANTYNLEVNLDGYQTATNSLIINTNKTETITLNPL